GGPADGIDEGDELDEADEIGATGGAAPASPSAASLLLPLTAASAVVGRSLSLRIPGNVTSCEERSVGRKAAPAGARCATRSLKGSTYAGALDVRPESAEIAKTTQAPPMAMNARVTPRGVFSASACSDGVSLFGPWSMSLHVAGVDRVGSGFVDRT